MGITDNTIKMLDHFNEKVEPRTDEEKEEELRRKQDLATLKNNGEEEKVENLKPPEMVRGIMKNCGEALEQITVPLSSNEYLSTRTAFSDTMTKTLENENNDSDYLITGLHALSNYLFKESGKNYSKLDLPQAYNLCKNLLSKYYSNPEILTNVNAISGALVKNLKDDGRGKDYTKKFYDLIPEITKVQDYNPDLVLMSLKLMNDGLVKKPYLVDEVYEETVPNVLSLLKLFIMGDLLELQTLRDVINMLKLYKDNPEIQENGYKILSAFAQNNVFASSMITNGLLDVMRDTLENTLFSDSLKENVIGLKSEIFQLLNTLSGEKET